MNLARSCLILYPMYNISMYRSYILVNATFFDSGTQIFIFEKHISSWELLTSDPLQVRLEALRQEHPGKSEEPTTWLDFFFFAVGVMCLGMFFNA